MPTSDESLAGDRRWREGFLELVPQISKGAVRGLIGSAQPLLTITLPLIGALAGERVPCLPAYLGSRPD